VGTERGERVLAKAFLYHLKVGYGRVGFNIVWSVLYEHREYNHSRLF